MIHPPLAPGHHDRPHLSCALGDLVLESGERIRAYHQSYVTHGRLNADRSNAVLACISLTGTHHRLDFLIGPGRALDTERLFIVVADPIGNGLSTSPSNSTQQPRMAFPRFTLRDMVAAQYQLLVEHLGIAKLRAVIGASMGGMQALQWAVSHPRFMDAAVAMTPLARTPAWAMLVAETARACLMADPAWNGQEFTAAPARGWRAYAGLMGALATRTPAAVAHFATPTAAHDAFEACCSQQLATGFDAHDYWYQSHAYAAHDVGGTAPFGGDTAAALRAIAARVLVLAPPLDLLNPQTEAREAATLIPGARYVEIPSAQGHMAATSGVPADGAFLNDIIGRFLAEERTSGV